MDAAGRIWDSQNQPLTRQLGVMGLFGFWPPLSSLWPGGQGSIPETVQVNQGRATSPMNWPGWREPGRRMSLERDGPGGCHLLGKAWLCAGEGRPLTPLLFRITPSTYGLQPPPKWPPLLLWPRPNSWPYSSPPSFCFPQAFLAGTQLRALFLMPHPPGILFPQNSHRDSHSGFSPQALSGRGVSDHIVWRNSPRLQVPGRSFSGWSFKQTVYHLLQMLTDLCICLLTTCLPPDTSSTQTGTINHCLLLYPQHMVGTQLIAGAPYHTYFKKLYILFSK